MATDSSPVQLHTFSPRQRSDMQAQMHRESVAFLSRPTPHNFRPARTTMDQLRHRARRRRWRIFLRTRAAEWWGEAA
jgi:hypothetical protein